MLAVLALAGMVSLSKAERDVDFDKPPHNTLHDCGSQTLQIGECRLPPNLAPQDIESHLAGKDTAWWREGDEFVVVARRDTDQAYVCCAVRAAMERVGDGQLWAIRLRIVGLDEATIDVEVEPQGATDGVYRGPAAPPRPVFADKLSGQVVQGVIDSKFLGEKRNLTIYLPPGFDRGKTYPVVYLADGAIRQETPQYIEPLILDGELPPLILVEIWQGVDRDNVNLRAEEYLLGWPQSMSYFLKHESFVLKEVLPMVEAQYGASSLPQDRVITGFSNGASWVASMGLRHPDIFPNVVAQSLGWFPVDAGVDSASAARFYLSAGTLEPTFLAQTQKFADRARASGHDVVMRIVVSGHSQTVWRPLLIDALKWAFAGRQKK